MKAAGLISESISGVRWIAFGKLIVQLISWAMTILVIRLLQPADYGLAALAALTTMLMGLLMDAGLGPAFIQGGRMSAEAYRSANGVLLLAAIGAVVLIGVTAEPIARFFAEPRVAWILRIASLQFVLSGLSVASNAEITTRMRFRDLTVVQTISGLAQGLATFVLALAGAAVWSLIVGTLIGSLTRLVLLLFYVDAPFGISFATRPLRPYWFAAKYLVGQRLAWYFADQSDQFFVGRFLGAASLGLYSIAKNLSNMPLDRVAEIVNQVSLPAFSRASVDPRRWMSGFEKLMRVSSALAFPLFWGMAAVAPVALPILLGPKWAGATLPFILLALPLPLRTAHALATTALFGLGRPEISFYTVLIWATVLVPAIWIGTLGGITGVAIAWVIAFPCVYFICVFVICRALGYRTGMMLRPLGAPAATAALSSLSALTVGWLLAAKLPAIAVLPAQVITGVAVYIGSLRLVSKERFDETAGLLMRLLNRPERTVFTEAGVP